MGDRETKWIQLLLNWINQCIRNKQVNELNMKSLAKIINKYKEDIFSEFDDIITLEDIEAFVAYKFPLLRLGKLYKNHIKKLYILTSLLLFYCCTNSKTGQVDGDICKNLTSDEQVMILKFCESLTTMEVTISNIETAIKAACNLRFNQESLNLEENQENMQTDSVSTNHSDSVNLSYDKTKALTLNFKSSITVLPSLTVTDVSLSKSDLERSDKSDLKVEYSRSGGDRNISLLWNTKNSIGVFGQNQDVNNNEIYYHGSSDHSCQPDCACSRCSSTGPCCGEPGGTKDLCDYPKIAMKTQSNMKWKYLIIISSVLLLLLVILLPIIPILIKRNSEYLNDYINLEEKGQEKIGWKWICKENFCKRIFHASSNISIYTSLSRCTLLCTGLPLWPYPIGEIYYNKSIVTLSTKKLKYKFLSVPSDEVRKYLAEAFKLFIKDLANLEKSIKSNNRNKEVHKINIKIEVESDPDPRLRVNTKESYTLKLDTINDCIFIKINSVSFCGVRNGIETLTQLILRDQSTGQLITLSNILIKDTPSYRYRGLMIDTARNYIPVTDLLRTIDTMATCKLNTLHWRISDATSFLLYLDRIPELNEHGPYDRAMIYLRSHIKFVVKRAVIRGIRILIEFSAPGPVGRPWAWVPEATCPNKDNSLCNNILCLRLSMNDSVFDLLQKIYSEIIDLTNVDDVFHLSDSAFTITNCYNIIDDRKGFLDKALDRLRLANKGFLPRLPIIWYPPHLKDSEATTWERFGIQIYNWDPNMFNKDLSLFRVIHSYKWDLSCEMKNKRCTKYQSWQEMYAWKSWRNINALTTEGGEAILWTDLVDSRNLDYHVWPRAAAVAERLWSDIVANSTANKYVYLRLDFHR